MEGTGMSAWESFYVIVGSSSAALIGLQFVVITLLAGERTRTSREALNAFGTPTVVHLAVAFLVSATMAAPWPSLVPAGVLAAACGTGGLAYGTIVLRRARRQTTYAPEREDWLWYVVLPWLVYAVLTVSALFLHATRDLAAFGVGGAALALVLVGIRNAWDSVTHHVVGRAEDVTTKTE